MLAIKVCYDTCPEVTAAFAKCLETPTGNLTARGFTVRVVVSVWLAIKLTEACVSPVYLVTLESTKQHLERENVKSVHRTAKHYLLVRRVSMRQDYYRAVSDPNL